jgi:hypothetical protein
MAASPQLDITIQDSFNTYYLSIADISEYPAAWTVSNATCEVTVPGFPKKAVTFTAKSVNNYKSSHLGITCNEEDDCVPLPDGIYTVKYSVAPNAVYFVEKSFMRVHQLRCRYGNAFLKADLADNLKSGEKRTLKKELYRVASLMEGAVAEANNCDTEAAYKYYRKASQILDKLESRCY